MKPKEIEVLAQVTSCEFWEIFYTFFIEHLRWLRQKFFENEQNVCGQGEKKRKHGKLPVGRVMLTILLKILCLFSYKWFFNVFLIC